MDDDWLVDFLNALEGLQADQAPDEVLELLSDRYIRYTLYYLSKDPTTSLDELADIIAGWEATETDAIITPADRERIRIRLYHVILPKLDDTGYLDFDTTDHTIKRSSVPSIVSTLLEDLL